MSNGPITVLVKPIILQEGQCSYGHDSGVTNTLRNFHICGKDLPRGYYDGSYSRGPVTIPVGEMSESNYHLTPTFKFEQCLVKGCHKRLRVAHTIEFTNGGADIQIMRVGVYEEQWVSPSNYEYQSNNDAPLELKPFSLRKHMQPSELAGSWKVFEVSATPIYGEEDEIELSGQSSETTPYVYLCTEALKRRNLPESSVSFGEKEMIDMQDVSVMWLPGGVTANMDVKKMESCALDLDDIQMKGSIL